MTTARSWEFYRHMPVYLSNGRHLGHTLEIGHAADYIHVQQGRWLVHDWYIPAEAIRDVTPDGVQLSVGYQDLRRNRWNVPAEAYLLRQGSTPGYEYTSPGSIPRYADTEPAGQV